MTTIFISDLHLDESHPTMVELFLRFLKTEAKQADVLYILGDFFESWIGDDNLSSFNQLIISALHEATQTGLPIYIMHGNRDFLLGKKFLKQTGCVLLPDEYVVNLYGRPTLLMHGDTLCTADTAYLKFRKKSRNWLLQKLFLMKPLDSRLAIAKKYREGSKVHTSTAADYIMDVTQDEVVRVMQKHNVLDLIHGHTHREAVHQFEIDEKPATRTVLGAWHEHGSALVCDVSNKNLIKIK